MQRNNMKKSWIPPRWGCRIVFACLLLVFFIVMAWMLRPTITSFSTTSEDALQSRPANTVRNRPENTVRSRPMFQNSQDTCVVDGIMDIGKLWDKIKTLKTKCPKEASILKKMFKISRRYGTVQFETKAYQNKVRKWLGDDQALFERSTNQSILSVYNLYTYEHILYNPLRSLRPISPPAIPALQYINKLTESTAKSCDFCNYTTSTARDVSGRLESDLSYTAANTFRYDAKHQLIMPRKHDPIKWSNKQLIDMFKLAIRWAEKTYKSDRDYSYPHIMWDLLPHAGASQVHPHLQIVLLPDQYPGVAESWRIGADRYQADSQSNYYTDLLRIHESLGLTAKYKTATAFASLTPKKDNEVVIISKEANEDHFNLLFMVLRTFIDDKKIYPFSLGMSLPQLYDKSRQIDERVRVIPAVTRVVTRGVVSEIRSDISALELFSFYNVNSDPFKLIKQIRDSVNKRKPTS